MSQSLIDEVNGYLVSLNNVVQMLKLKTKGYTEHQVYEVIYARHKLISYIYDINNYIENDIKSITDDTVKQITLNSANACLIDVKNNVSLLDELYMLMNSDEIIPYGGNEEVYLLDNCKHTKNSIRNKNNPVHVDFVTTVKKKSDLLWVYVKQKFSSFIVIGVILLVLMYLQGITGGTIMKTTQNESIGITSKIDSDSLRGDSIKEEQDSMEIDVYSDSEVYSEVKGVLRLLIGITDILLLLMVLWVMLTMSLDLILILSPFLMDKYDVPIIGGILRKSQFMSDYREGKIILDERDIRVIRDKVDVIINIIQSISKQKGVYFNEREIIHNIRRRLFSDVTSKLNICVDLEILGEQINARLNNNEKCDDLIKVFKVHFK